MRKIFKKICALALVCAMTVQPIMGNFGDKQVNAVGIADTFKIPAADANGRVGAEVPYTRYDSMDAKLGGSAVIATSPNFKQRNIATQASEQSYVRLPSNGAYAEWTMKTTGAGVTMRFTMPDSGSKGLKGSVDVYVNGSKFKTIDLTSYYMWQYFAGGHPSDTDDGGASAFAFDEVHFLLDKSLQVGDRIRIQSSGANGLEYGVDFLEIEEVPAPIDQPDNAVSVEDYGAYPDDGVDDLDAIRRAVADADKRGMDVYFPEGTFHLSGMWNLGGSNMKITGAGMWYTNLQFTSDQKFGGGIAGGNPNAGDGSVADGYCKNIEFCNMYINSNLCSRYDQLAVYKCFMDIFGEGSVIHDVWEEHFECGFWLGDYNGSMDYSDGLKIIDCRIRNNFADGVNFCMGTSNAVVYNCSIRNNGDDGLAMWNNSSSEAGTAHDETNNIFAYNTIDFIWRAGGIAIYGGEGHKVYNNYICDTFMASGIHLNTEFAGYKFGNTKEILFENNIMVRCGSNADSWGRSYGAIMLEGEVQNLTFKNNQIYDAQGDGIFINGCGEGVKFIDTKIFGSGYDGQDITWSCNPHLGAAVRVSNDKATFDGLEIANVAWKGENTPYFFSNGKMSKATNVTVYDDDTTYEVPGYPDPVNGQGGGIVNPLEGITGYDLVVTGLSWANAEGSTVLKNGDKVTFTIQIKNDSNVDIPAEVKIPTKVTIDDKTSLRNSKFKDGLKAGETATLTMTSTWTAVKGGHTVTATVDDTNKLPDEKDENNNTRVKKINVADTGVNTNVTRVTGGADLVVTDITYGQETIATGDRLKFTAIVVNAGDTAVPSGVKIGVQFQFDGKAYPADITWCDTYFDGLEPGESVELTANGGNGTNGAFWAAESGSHTVTAWVDDQSLISEVDKSNNRNTITLTIPYGGVQYFDNPDSPDDFSGTGGGEEQPTKPQETEKPTESESNVSISKDVHVTGYQISSTLGGSRVVASVEPVINGKNVVKSGLVYALSKVGNTDTNVKDDDMYVGSENNYVASFESTDKGTLNTVMGASKTAKYYVMTTLFEHNTATEFSAKYKVRAYALLSDGSYVYSNIFSYSVYDVASALYDGRKMPTNAGHTYLYESILKAVNPSYKQVDYNWSDIVVGFED